MPPITVPTHGVMEGDGAYNRRSAFQAAGAALAFPLLEKAAGEVAVDSGMEPVTIADYGSAQGKNSLAPVRKAIETLRSRIGRHRPVLVFHIDQPSNDFNTLFRLLDTDSDRYARDDLHVYPCAVGRSFYEQVLPPDSVHLAWCSYAALWLSAVPTRITGHFNPIHASGAERAAFESQAAKDWEAFLTLRAAELRAGGRLVVVLPGLDDDGSSGFETLLNHANSVLAEMVEDGAIRAEERDRMALGTYPRRRSELLAPFRTKERFRNLALEQCELLSLPDSAWADFERHGNRDWLARRRALFFRAVFVPSLALGLAECDSPEKCQAFADEFEARLTRVLTEQPAPLHSFVQIFVAAKSASGETP
ncbi:MAG: hypothetical protein WB524_09395 [Acidobacteriaceae bacterium]